MEIAMPASDMMFEVTPMKYMGMKHSTTEIGIVMIGTMADGMCQRKKRITTLTMSISMISSCFRLSMDFWINSDRSYVVTNSTPSGNFISACLALTALMTLSAFSPWRI